MQHPERLTEAQREAIVTEITDMRDASENLTIDREGIAWKSSYDSDDRADDTEYLESLSDADLMDFWYALVGESIEDSMAEDGHLSHVWENAEFDGIQTPADWQFEKLLNGDERDYEIPTVVNVITTALQEAPCVVFAKGRLEYLLEIYDLGVDEDGYIIDTETDSWKEPFSFDAHDTRTFLPFRDLAYDSEDDPLLDRLAKQREETGDRHLHRADRIHVEDFGGLIHPAVTPTGSVEILQDRHFDMIQLAAAGVLTANLKAFSPSTAVLTTEDQQHDYHEYASAVYEMPDEDVH